MACWPAGYKALDLLRLEKGYRYWSTDMTPVENPYEAGLGFCVRLNKGDFIGREALLAIKAQGSLRRLSTLTLDGQAAVYGGEAVYAADGQLLGRLRSGGFGYTVGKVIGLAYLPRDLAWPGTTLAVEVFGERLARRGGARRALRSARPAHSGLKRRWPSRLKTWYGAFLIGRAGW